MEDCNFETLAPEISSLCNLETLTLADCICGLERLQDLDKLTHLIIHLKGSRTVWLDLVCPCNLRRLEIKLIGPFDLFEESEIFEGHDWDTDMVYCNVIATFIALTRQHS